MTDIFVLVLISVVGSVCAIVMDYEAHELGGKIASFWYALGGLSAKFLTLFADIYLVSRWFK